MRATLRRVCSRRHAAERHRATAREISVSPCRCSTGTFAGLPRIRRDDCAMDIIEERAPNGCARIEDVISLEELADVTSSFAAAAALDFKGCEWQTLFVPLTHLAYSPAQH